MSYLRRLLLLAVVGLGTVAVGAVAWAYFTSSGSGSASAGVGSLAAPTGVTVPGISATGTVHVTWTGVTAPTGSTNVAYWVRRYVGTTPTDACGSSLASPIAAGTGAKSCDDTNVANGTYTYRVTSVWRTWTAQSAASSSVTVAALDHFAVSAPGSATAGTAFTVTVTAKDSSNSTITAYAGSVHFTTSDVASPVLPADYTFVSGDNGAHTFSNAVTLKTAGAQTVSVNDTVQTSKTGTSSTITVAAAGLDHFVVTAPSSATAGTSFATATVTARDLYNNAAGGWTSATQCVAFSGPSSAPSGTAPSYPAPGSCSAGQSSLSFNASGQASGFASTLYKAETTSLTATASAKTGTSGSIAVAASALDHFAVTAPASASVATAFATATVTAQDLYNNPASTWTSATKCVSFSGPGSAPNGTAPSYPAQGGCAAGQSSLSFNASGQASGFAITLYKAETSSLTATASAKTGTSGSIVVSPGTATGFFVTAPSSTPAGTTFAVTSLTARDAYNNTATSYTGTHTIAWSGPGNAPSGTPPTFPGTSVSFTGGVASTVGNATLVKAENATLTASETAGPSGSASITVNPGSAANFLLTAPANATAGSAFTVTSLTARDSFNNTATGYTAGNHTITWSGASSSPDGTAATYPTSTVSFTGGVSTTVLSATLVKAESVTLTAKEGSSPSGTASITVSPGTAANLAWTSPTSANGSAAGVCLFTCTWNTIGRGNNWTASVSVTDARGNIVSNLGSGHTVALTKTGGTLTPTSLTIATSGPATSTATFTFTSQSGNGWSSDTVTATSSGYTNATITFNK